MVGILSGAFTSEALHMVRDKHRHEVFDERLRCKSLADAYIKANSDEHSYLMLERVDFSPSRNSCIATSRGTNLQDGDERYFVVDVISGERLFNRGCSGDETSKSYCGNGRNGALKDERDKTFERAVGSFW
jgi:hypothetical protein